MASASHGPFVLSLGKGALSSVEVYWPSGTIEPQKITFDEPIRNRKVCIERKQGVVPCVALLAQVGENHLKP